MICMLNTCSITQINKDLSLSIENENDRAFKLICNYAQSRCFIVCTYFRVCIIESPIVNYSSVTFDMV